MHQDALGAVFAERAVPLRRTAYLLCGDWNRAEDLVQTAFVRTFAAWHRLRDPQAVEAYLRRTLLHAHLDDSRRRWRGEVATEVLPEEPVASSDSVTDDRLLLLEALATVPPRQRACLVLRYFDDCSVDETARVLDCSTGTVKSNTARGLTALRTALGSSFLEPTAACREE